MLRRVINEQKIARILKRHEIPEHIISHYLNAYREGINGNSGQLVTVALVLHENEYFEEAHELFQIAALSQNADALYHIGNYAFEGLVGEENEEKAFIAYEKAAQLGHPDAMNNLADMYLNGEGVEQDEVKARTWFEKAAEKGVPEAKFTLGMIHELGIGTEVNEEKALNYYKEAAADDDVEALYRLGTIYLEGLLNVAPNRNLAIAYFELAADLNHVDALFNLGYLYETGIHMDVDGSKALEYYLRGAEMYDFPCIEAVIRLYKEGKVIAQNEVAAKKWSNYLNNLL